MPSQSVQGSKERGEKQPRPRDAKPVNPGLKEAPEDLQLDPCLCDSAHLDPLVTESMLGKVFYRLSLSSAHSPLPAFRWVVKPHSHSATSAGRQKELPLRRK